MQVHWVPGHIEVEGNEKAYEAAKVVVKVRGIRGFPERFTSFANIGRTVT